MGGPYSCPFLEHGDPLEGTWLKANQHRTMAEGCPHSPSIAPPLGMVGPLVHGRPWRAAEEGAFLCKLAGFPGCPSSAHPHTSRRNTI